MSAHPTILILDDEPLMRLMLKDGMESAGFFTEAVGTCAEALRVIRSGTVDAGLFDMRLPDGSGLDVIRSLRAQGKRFPVMVLSAEANCVASSVMDELELVAVCMKPPSIPDLVDQLQRALGIADAVSSAPAVVGTYRVWDAATGDLNFFDALDLEHRVVIDCSGIGEGPLASMVDEFICSAGDRVAVSGAHRELKDRWATRNASLLCVSHLEELAATERRFNSSAERTALLDSVVRHHTGGSQ